MCFPKPKPPSVPAEDPLLKQQVEAATRDERERRADQKKMRTEEAIQSWSGGYGRRSLLSGSRGGMGFAAPLMRSLLQAG